MRFGKKSMTAVAFTVGACVFLSTAFADAMLGSGYDQLKGTAKLTAAQMEKGLNNYTVEALISLKDNGQSLFQVSNFSKIDTEKQATENTSTTQYSNGEARSNFSYLDKKYSVYKNETDNKYYVSEMPENIERGNSFSNPFNEKGAPEVEKIVDAVVGNLKDYVQAEERPEGGKSYSGSLSEAQVPAVVNAVASFGIKQMINEQGRMGRNSNMPDIESDIYVKKVTGTALENKAGLLESLTGDVILTGKDKNGAQHDLSLSVIFKLSNIGSTKVAMPDLTGANVERVSQNSGFSSKYVGKYSNNVIKEKDGKFVKIGERTLEILSISEDKVTGKYYETAKPGFEAEFGAADSFQFEYNLKQNGNGMNFFKYTNAKGEQKNGQLHASGSGKLYLELDIEILDSNSFRSQSPDNFDREFSRVFE